MMDIQYGQEIVLASASPRRRQIFQAAGFEFTVIAAQVDETIPPGAGPEEAVKTLALRKAEAVAPLYPDRLVVGADTLVYHREQLLEKPLSQDHARELLLQLEGEWHTVYTGFALVKLQQGISLSQAEQTRVRFLPHRPDFIDWYVATGEPMDKAGAYGIQEKGSLLVERVEGCYFNVMGFPIAAFFRELSRLFAADEQC